MTYDDGENLFEEEFDFVDDVDDVDDDDEIGDGGEIDNEQASSDKSDKSNAGDSDSQEEAPPASKPKRRGSRKGTPRVGKRKAAASSADEGETAADGEPADAEASEPAEEAKPEEPVGPPTDHVVHLYEFGEFNRTITREFTGEDAEAFVVEFNRTGDTHGRKAVAAARDSEPAPSV